MQYRASINSIVVLADTETCKDLPSTLKIHKMEKIRAESSGIYHIVTCIDEYEVWADTFCKRIRVETVLRAGSI